MGGIVSFAKKIWNGVKNFFKKVWNGIKKVAKKVWNGVKKVVKELVKTTIGGIVVMVEVVASLVAGTIIGSVLASFTLGLLGGGFFFMSLFIPTLLIFGRYNRQQNNNDEENENKDNTEEQNNYKVPNTNEEKPNFDKESKKKPIDQLDDFLKNINSFIYEPDKILTNNEKGTLYTFDKNGKGTIKEKNDDDNDDDDDDDDDDDEELDENKFKEKEYITNNVMSSYVIMNKNESSLYKIKFENEISSEDNTIAKTIIRNVENKLKDIFPDYSLSYLINDKNGNEKEKKELEDDDDFILVTMVIKKKETFIDY